MTADESKSKIIESIKSTGVGYCNFTDGFVWRHRAAFEDLVNEGVIRRIGVMNKGWHVQTYTLTEKGDSK